MVLNVNYLNTNNYFIICDSYISIVFSHSSCRKQHTTVYQKLFRISHAEVERNLSDEDFRKHYRMRREDFKYILEKIRKKLDRGFSYQARNCKMPHAAMTPDQMLGTLLKHLGGSLQHDNDYHYKFHRSTIQKQLYRTMEIICDEFPIPCFPFKDRNALQIMSKDWQRRSAGGLFTSCVGAFDGYLLRISKACVHGDKVTNPQKYYCRKGFYAVNCQVCCDAHRRVTWMSLSHPGACPDVTAFKQSVMFRAMEHGLLPHEFYFIGDNAYPPSNQMLTPFNSYGLKKDPRKRDSYNFYLSQLRINIECVFGILVNRFPILQRSLKCRLLERAILTFRTCVVLHNILVTRHLNTFKKSCDDSTRLVQVPNHKIVKPKFVEVPGVDETNIDDLTNLFQTHMGLTQSHVPTSDRREQYVQKIHNQGYVRPKITRYQRRSMQLCN